MIGPNADEARHLVGDYAYAVHVESLQEVLRSGRNVFDIPIDEQHSLDAVDHRCARRSSPNSRDRFGDRVRFARGCEVNSAERTGFAEAVAVAAEMRCRVMVMGDKAGLTDDCTSGESRDVASLDLPGVQEELVHAVLDTGTPVVLVLVAGRPIGSAALHERCAAVLMAWLPGEAGGSGDRRRAHGCRQPRGQAADHLPAVGRADPRRTTATSCPEGARTGRATTSTLRRPRCTRSVTAQLHDVRAQDDVLGCQRRVSWNDVDHDDVTITNTGGRDGDEVVQLYVRDPSASVTRPVLELKGFVARHPRRRRVAAGHLHDPGRLSSGFTTVTSPTSSSPGELDVFVGTSCVDLVEAGTVTVVADPTDPPAKVFDGTVTVA